MLLGVIKVYSGIEDVPFYLYEVLSFVLIRTAFASCFYKWNILSQR